MRETEGGVPLALWRTVRQENGRFPGDLARPADRRQNPPENPLRN
jgi:hypothetical protein